MNEHFHKHGKNRVLSAETERDVTAAECACVWFTYWPSFRGRMFTQLYTSDVGNHTSSYATTPWKLNGRIQRCPSGTFTFVSPTNRPRTLSWFCFAASEPRRIQNRTKWVADHERRMDGGFRLILNRKSPRKTQENHINFITKSIHANTWTKHLLKTSQPYRHTNLINVLVRTGIDLRIRCSHRGGHYYYFLGYWF